MSFDSLGEGSEKPGLIKQTEIIKLVDAKINQIADPETRNKLEEAVSILLANLLRIVDVAGYSENYHSRVLSILEHVAGLTGLYADKLMTTIDPATIPANRRVDYEIEETADQIKVTTADGREAIITPTHSDRNKRLGSR
jgi:hypothetical protein